MVVPAIVLACQSALAVDGSAELAAPDHQRLVEHAEPFEVLDQAVAGLVDVAALNGQVGNQVAVLVPAAMEDLREAHAALGQAPGQKTARRERAGPCHLGAVQIAHVLRLVVEVEQFRHARLHAEGHLVLLDARLRIGVADLRELPLVELGERVEHAPPGLRIDAGRVGQEQHRVALRAQRDARVLARQEARAP